MFFLQTIALSLATQKAWHPAAGWNRTTVQPTALLPTSSAVYRQVVEIQVGAAGDLIFNPESVSVTKGTILRFNFLGFNHSLTQSSFSHPCTNSSRFDTGFQQFNPLNISGKFLIDYEVRSDEPQWFYCAQEINKSHCRNGMVFSLNPGGRQREFVANARQSIAHPMITTSPGSPNCPGQPPKVTVSDATSFRPSNGTGTVSWPTHRSNTTSIFPEISNSGEKLTCMLGLIFACAMLVFGF